MSSLAHDFETAFALYPKKESKDYAWTAWIKLARSGQLPPLDVILNAIRRFMATEKGQREQAAPYPAF